MTTLQVPDELSRQYESMGRRSGRSIQDHMLDALKIKLEELEAEREMAKRVTSAEPIENS